MKKLLTLFCLCPLMLFVGCQISEEDYTSYWANQLAAATAKDKQPSPTPPPRDPSPIIIPVVPEEPIVPTPIVPPVNPYAAKEIYFAKPIPITQWGNATNYKDGMQTINGVTLPQKEFNAVWFEALRYFQSDGKDQATTDYWTHSLILIKFDKNQGARAIGLVRISETKAGSHANVFN